MIVRYYCAILVNDEDEKREALFVVDDLVSIAEHGLDAFLSLVCKANKQYLAVNSNNSYCFDFHLFIPFPRLIVF